MILCIRFQMHDYFGRLVIRPCGFFLLNAAWSIAASKAAKEGVLCAILNLTVLGRIYSF